MACPGDAAPVARSSRTPSPSRRRSHTEGGAAPPDAHAVECLPLARTGQRGGARRRMRNRVASTFLRSGAGPVRVRDPGSREGRWSDGQAAPDRDARIPARGHPESGDQGRIRGNVSFDSCRSSGASWRGPPDRRMPGGSIANASPICMHESAPRTRETRRNARSGCCSAATHCRQTGGWQLVPSKR